MSPGPELSLDLGNFAPFALLTGAGFSCNWGGLPAGKIWEKVVGARTLFENERLQRVLGRAAGDYELALHLARQSNECTPDDRRLLEETVVDVFRSQEARIWSLGNRQKLNEHMVREFLSLFGPGPMAPNVHAGYETGYIFTLNQDWLVERLWDGAHPGFRHKPFVPGIPLWMERYPTHRRDAFDVTDIRRVPDSKPERWPPKLRENQNYIKLHGSFEWRSSDGSNVLVMGGGKSEQIQSLPLLTTFFEIFRRVCETPGLRLMIIGYGFGDPHVNQVLADACRKRAGERCIFVIDLLPAAAVLDRLRSKGGADGATVADAIFGWSSEPLTDIFAPPGGNHRTEEYRRILRDFFRLDLPG